MTNDTLHLFETGNDHYRAGRLTEAAACYQAVLRLVPTHPESHNNLGAALADLGRLDEAIAAYLQSLQLNPAYAEAHFNLGNALRQARYYVASAQCYRRAVEFQPRRPEFLLGLANGLARLGATTEAEAAYRQALALRPDYPEALTSRGLLLAEQGRLEDADACHTAALQLLPNYPEAHRNRSLVRLLRGDFPAGWQDYEWRWQCRDFAYLRLPQPRWRGEDLPGKTVLLYTEQGMGDAIQFVRYLPLVKAKVGRVVLATWCEMMPILHSCDGVDELVPLASDLPPYDVHCPLMSLPGVFGTTLENIPGQHPYLRVDRKRQELWRGRLQSMPGFRVGLCWRGSSGNEYYREHSIPTACLAGLADVKNVSWVSLQKDANPQELKNTPLPLMDLSANLDMDGQAFMDTAAVISLLDLVISFDTAVAHVAGALGKPVWIALPFVPEWRWLLAREDSPWYPTARLFRQPEPGNWDQPLRAMAEELQRS